MQKELHDKISVLKQENSRLRGVDVETDEGVGASGDDRDRIIRGLDQEVAKLKQVIASLKLENQKARLQTQRAELANERYLKLKAELTAIQYT